jgi:hypothetical protein
MPMIRLKMRHGDTILADTVVTIQKRGKPRAASLLPFRKMTREDIRRLVIALLLEEAIGEYLAPFRSKNLLTEPLQRQEELFVVGRNVMPICNRAG